MKMKRIVFAAIVGGALTMHAQAQPPSLLNYQGRVTVGGTNFHGTGQFKFALVDAGVDQSEQATATRSIFMGVILNIFVNFGGSGYTSVPEVHIIDTTGSGAEAIAQIGGGAVTNVVLLQLGSNYSSDTIIVIDPPSPDILLATLWSHDDTSMEGGEPASFVSLSVHQGLYSVLLGNTALTNMVALPANVFTNTELYLRVWFSDGESGFQMLAPDQRVAAVGYALMAGNVADGSITSEKFASGAVANHLASENQSAVPQSGLILSQTENNSSLQNAGYVRIGTIQGGNTWGSLSTISAPSERNGFSLVWTGNSLILWGGVYFGGVSLSNGASFNPNNNLWTSISTVNAPSARRSHTAVWTGTEMIVWGGISDGNVLNTGARYNPTTALWTPMSTNNAPVERDGHTAIWTGTEMIVWGGGEPFGGFPTGGRYNPVTDTWSATSLSGAPQGRSRHSAVWTGSEMIVWGGLSGVSQLNSGGRYNPVANSWSSVNTVDSPSARSWHSAVWSGSEMIVWSGNTGGSNYPQTGGRYTPGNNTWSIGGTATVGAPVGRGRHDAFWAGNRMLVWGGTDGAYMNTGGMYDPVQNTWTSTSLVSAPPPDSSHKAMWTGSDLMVWGGPFSPDRRLWKYRPDHVMYLFQRP